MRGKKGGLTDIIKIRIIVEMDITISHIREDQVLWRTTNTEKLKTTTMNVKKTLVEWIKLVGNEKQQNTILEISMKDPPHLSIQLDISLKSELNLALTRSSTGL